MQGPNTRVLRVVFIALAVVLLGSCNNSGGASGTDAPCNAQECKLIASDATFENSFGLSVDISGDVAVVGASLNGELGVSAGAAYVFNRDGSRWIQVQKLLPDDGEAGARFGSSVSIDDDVIVVGARTSKNGGGASVGFAYVFRLVDGEWEQEAKLFAFDGVDGDSFGKSVAVSGDVIVVGAYRDDLGANIKAGSAWVFRFNGTVWVIEQKLVASDRTTGDFFGGAVAVSGDVLVIGAIGEEIRTVKVGANEPDTDSGAAYVFTFGGASWTQANKLKAQRKPLACEGAGTQFNFNLGDHFGVSVDVDNGRVVVGADGVEFRRQPLGGACQLNTLVSNSGAAYVYEETAPASGSWTFKARLEPSDPTPNQLMGRSVGVSGDVIVAGARGDSDAASFAGSAYVFRNTAMVWSQAEKITASDAESLDWFGESISVDGDKAIVGAFGVDDSGPLSGAAYAYEL